MVEVKDFDDKTIFTFKNTHNTIINSIRRVILDEVPTFAIEDVEVVENGSPLYDETIAQRLGLVPLKTDLDSYKFKSECSCSGVGCAMCEVKMQIKSDGDGYVYSSNITSDDPQIVPVDTQIPIAKLFHSKKLEMNLVAVLGKGFEHAKWSPAHSYLKELDDGQVELIVEPFGQLSSKQIYNEAVDILIGKISELEENL